MRESVRSILNRPQAGGEATVNGWVRTARHGKSCTFLEIYDGSCFASLQAVVEPSSPAYEEAKRLRTGCAVEVTGAIVASPGREQKYELQAAEIKLIGAVGDDYPLQKKAASYEFLRTVAHLRLRTNTFGAILRVRNAAAMAIHEFFQERGFVWLHTPIITASDCEGAGAMFRVSALDADQPPRTPEGKTDFKRDFFGREARLTVSGQLEGECGALAVSKVYTFGPTFRAEDSNTARHLAEFWMVEPEMAFCDLRGNMDLAEAFLKHLFRRVLERCLDDMRFFADRIDRSVIDTLTHIIDSSFARITYTEAIAILEKSGWQFVFPVKWGCDLQSEHERYITEEHIKRPVIVTDYPKEIKAFYMYLNDDQRTVRGMDILVPKVGEIIGGAQREDRLPVLKARMAEMGLREADYWWYLDLRRHGSAPHSGFGLGFERAIQFITGMQNIRDVIPFPRVPGYAEF